MERGLPRTSLNGSALIGWLERLALVERPPVPPGFVQGLGRWLGWADAIALSAALRAPPPVGAPAPVPAPVPAPAAVAGSTGTGPRPPDAEFDRVRTALARAIADDTACATDTVFAPHRRRCIGLQQAMEATIGPLRAQARAALAQRSPRLGRLAALDAVMDEALAAHTHAALATLPARLETHFLRLRRAAAATAGASTTTDTTTTTDTDADAGTQPPGPWLTRFRQDMQGLLLAELALRLQPVQGLLDALRTAPQGIHAQALHE